MKKRFLLLSMLLIPLSLHCADSGYDSADDLQPPILGPGRMLDDEDVEEWREILRTPNHSEEMASFWERMRKKHPEPKKTSGAKKSNPKAK